MFRFANFCQCQLLPRSCARSRGPRLTRGWRAEWPPCLSWAVARRRAFGRWARGNSLPAAMTRVRPAHRHCLGRWRSPPRGATRGHPCCSHRVHAARERWGSSRWGACTAPAALHPGPRGADDRWAPRGAARTAPRAAARAPGATSARRRNSLSDHPGSKGSVTARERAQGYPRGHHWIAPRAHPSRIRVHRDLRRRPRPPASTRERTKRAAMGGWWMAWGCSGREGNRARPQGTCRQP